MVLVWVVVVMLVMLVFVGVELVVVFWWRWRIVVLIGSDKSRFVHVLPKADHTLDPISTEPPPPPRPIDSSAELAVRSCNGILILFFFFVIVQDLQHPTSDFRWATTDFTDERLIYVNK